MPPQLPNLYPEKHFPQEPLRSAYIENLKNIQKGMYPDTPPKYLPIAEGNEIIALHLVMQAIHDAKARVNPRANSTNGDTDRS